MSKCNIDHSYDDVMKKLESQKDFLSQGTYEKSIQILESNPDQLKLNELFHLLKKYDLASDEEKRARDEKIKVL